MARRDTRHAAFRGCIDWHSAAHGTWALLILNQRLKDPRIDALLAERLTPRNLEAERALLIQQPGFETPYGRAWLLRLAIDHHRYTKSDALRALGDVGFETLDAYYSVAGPDHAGLNYDSAAWALANMLDYARYFGRRDATRRIERTARRFLSAASRPCDDRIERGRFMAVCANLLFLAGRVMDRPAFMQYAATLGYAPERAQPVERPVSSHHAGLNFSRAWGFWTAYAQTGDPRFARAFAAHFLASYERPQYWAERYRSYAHWVAQFGALALQPTLGQPRDSRPD